jgi:hypothetical protein
MALSVTDIDQAITAVLTAQSYRLPDGTEVTHANLAELRKLRTQALLEADTTLYHALEVEL